MNEANWLENEANRHSTPDIQRACGISAVHFYPKPTQIAREMKGNKRHFNNEWYISIHIFTPQNSFKPFAKQTNTHMRSGSFEAQKNHALRHQKPLFATISTSGGPTRFNRMLYDVVISKHCFNNAFSNKITHKSPRIWNWYASLGCIRWVKMWEILHLRHPQCMDICIIVRVIGVWLQSVVGKWQSGSLKMIKWKCPIWWVWDAHGKKKVAESLPMYRRLVHAGRKNRIDRTRMQCR